MAGSASGLLASIGPLHWLLLAGLAVTLFLVLRALRKKPVAPSESPMDLSSLTIRDARRGDLVTIRGAAPDFEDLEFPIDKIHRYESGGESWFEATGVSPHGRVCVEWYDDDGLQVSWCMTGEERRIEALGLGEEDLVRMDEEQSSANAITFDGARFSYDASGEIGYFEDGRGGGEGYYCWEFDEVDGKRSLSIEKWEGEAFEVIVSTRVDPSEVQVYRR